MQHKIVPQIKNKSDTKNIYADVHEGPMKFPPNQFYIDQIKQLSDCA